MLRVVAASPRQPLPEEHAVLGTLRERTSMFVWRLITRSHDFWSLSNKISAAENSIKPRSCCHFDINYRNMQSRLSR